MYYAFIIASLLIAPIAVLSGLAAVPLMVLTAVPTLWHILRHRAWNIGYLKTLPPLQWWLLFLGYGLLSLLWAKHFGFAWHVWIKMLSVTCCGLVLVHGLSLLTPAQTNRLGECLLYGLFAALIMMMVELAAGNVLSAWMHHYLLHQPFVVPTSEEMNRGATVIALLIWPGLYVVLQQRARPFVLISWFAVLMVLLQLESLSAIIAFLTASFSCLIVLRFGNRAVYALAGSVAASFVLIPLAMSMVYPEMLIAEWPRLPLSAQHRLYIWEFAFKHIMNGPWEGVGLGGFRFLPVAPGDIRNPLLPPNLPHPHNNVLQLLLETGVPGMLLFLGMLLALFRAIAALPATNTQKALYTSTLITYFTVGLFAFNSWQTWWVVMGFFAVFYLHLCVYKPSAKIPA